MSTLVASNLQASGGGGTAATLASINGGPISGFRNRVINGDMRIDQRNSGAALTLNSANAGAGFPVDRFRAAVGGGSWGTGVISAQQRNGIITANTNYEAGASPDARVCNSSLKLTVTTADASLASTDGYALAQPIEIGTVSDFAFGTANAQTVTLSFWVKSSVTGTYCAGIVNTAVDRSYVATYSISTANTWQKVELTIPGDTSGTWFQTDPAIVLRWDLGSGSNSNAASANTWSTGNFTRVSSAVNWISTLNATFYITGVQLELGSIATPFERRSYGQELALCQRYYETASNVTTGMISIGSTSRGAPHYFKASKRASPTTTYGGVIAYTSTGVSLSSPTAADNLVTTEFAYWMISNHANAAQAGANITASAEL